MVDKKNGIEVVEVDEKQRLVRLRSTAMPHIIFSFQLAAGGKVLFYGREGPAHAPDPLYRHLKKRATAILRSRFGQSSNPPPPHL